MDGRRTLWLLFLSMLIAASAVVMVGWFTPFRDVARAAVISVAVFALLPFAVFAGAMFLVVAAMFLSVLGGLGFFGGMLVHAGGEAAGEASLKMAPKYYRWLASRRHPVFWGVPLGLLLGGLTLSWMLALVDVPKEGNTAQSLAEVQDEIERAYRDTGRYPKATEDGRLTWAALGKPNKGMFVLDGFARPVEYRVAGAWKVAAYRVRSYGYDGRPGGNDDLCVSGGTALGTLASRVKADKEAVKWSVKAKLARIGEMRCRE
jgi:hypothetical protein